MQFTFTELLILLGLVLMYIWMALNTTMYFRVLRAYHNLEKRLQEDERLIQVQDSVQDEAVRSIDYFLRFLEGFQEDADAIQAKSAEILDLTTQRAEHVRKTAQEARRLYRRSKEMQDKTEEMEQRIMQFIKEDKEKEEAKEHAGQAAERENPDQRSDQ